MIVSDADGSKKVLTGSTNFSITKLYVNSNHVIIFEDPKVAGEYQAVFNASWTGDVKLKAFVATKLSTEAFSAASNQTPVTEITFSPHGASFAVKILDGMAHRIRQEAKTSKGSVFFAVMELGGKATGPVIPALIALYKSQDIFSYGISDTTEGYATLLVAEQEGSTCDG